MPFKKMTVREQIKAKRELKRLRRLEDDLRYSGQWIASGSVCDFAGGAINAAIRLGYIVVVRGGGSGGATFRAFAYRLGGQ